MRTVAAMRRVRSEWSGSAVGLVPTMGYLHEGHLSLVRLARAQCAHVVATIFVNPTQFGPAEDYKSYPRDEERDLALLEREGVDAVFVPRQKEIYPPGFSAWVEVGGPLTTRLEGKKRPGHFRGVTTVVAKLLNIVQPERAYLGEKDYQQLLVVRKMVGDLNLPLEVVGVPTVRDEDGLALSSRNEYLSPEERRRALALPQALQLAEELVEAGTRDAGVLRRRIKVRLVREPGLEVDYVSIADSADLEELAKVNRPARVLAAVRVGRTRLIDNLALEP